MQVDQKILARFNELVEMGNRVLGTMRRVDAWEEVDAVLATQWGVSCLHILDRVFTNSSDHYGQFTGHYDNVTYHSSAKRALAVLKAAKDDFEHELLFEVRQAIEAEVFEDFLEQAEHLLKAGYTGPSAVIVGAVLEDGLRKLCDRNTIAVPVNATINPLNDALAKANVYNRLMQKRITELADIRNNAAHGKWSEFSKDDVADMLKHVQDFMTDHFS